MLELKLIFVSRHNLQGKYDNIPYDQSGFYWRKIKVKWLRLTAVMSSQDKRSHNRLLSGEIEQAGVKLSCACNTGVKMIQNLLIQLRKSAFLM